LHSGAFLGRRLFNSKIFAEWILRALLYALIAYFLP
jgi:hypothetical protein